MRLKATKTTAEFNKLKDSDSSKASSAAKTLAVQTKNDYSASILKA
jgi:hypothetical protein